MLLVLDIFVSTCLEWFGWTYRTPEFEHHRHVCSRIQKHGAWGKVILSGRVVDEPLCLYFSCGSWLQPESKSEVSEGLSSILFDWICSIKRIHDMILI